MWDSRNSIGNFMGWALLSALCLAGATEATQSHPEDQGLSPGNKTKSLFPQVPTGGSWHPAEEGVKGNHSGNQTDHSHEGEHEEHRYHVAHVDFSHVSTPYIISLWVLLASLAKIGFHSTEKLSRIFPESCLLIVLGVMVGVALYFSSINSYVMSSKTFFLYLLPPIILEAGYFMPNRAFFDNIGTILLFAVIGTIFNTVLIGASLWGFSSSGLGVIPFQISILHCFVFASLISAVDPVAVLAVFEEVHVNDVLHIVVFGESLLNDGVSVVLYHMFESYSKIGLSNILAIDIAAGVGSFFAVALGGTLIGVVVGFLTAFLSRFTSHVPVIEPLLVFLMGYLAYLTAEVFHFSGILACTFCGITMKRYVEANISRKSHTTIKYFMKMLASVCETIIFVFLGLSTVTDNHEWNTAFILLTLGFCLLYRAVGVVVLTFLANLFRIKKLNHVEQFIMAYGGLRGAVAFSLVILLSSEVFPQKRLMVTTTVVVIYFTVFLQGVTIKPLVNILRVQKSNKHKPTMNEQIHLRLTDHLMAGIEDITGNFGHHEIRERFEYINSKYLKPLLLRPSRLCDAHRGSSIVNVYRKLMEHDAQDFINRHGSFSLSKIQEEMSRRMSLTQIFQSYSQSSISSCRSEEMPTHINGTAPNGLPMPDISSHTCLDMKALETQDCKKMKDDSKIHHLLEDSMFKTRKRFSHSRYKHAISDPVVSEQVHHTMRYNLRHLVKSNPANGRLTVSIEEPSRKPKKNVSFADEIDKHMQLYGDLTMEEVPLKSDMGDPFDSDGESGEADSTNVEYSEDKSDSSSDEGITFTVKEPVHVPSPPPPPPEQTAAELMLPWKRNTGQVPLSSSSTHTLPDDDIPQVGEAPSWVQSTGDLATSTVSPDRKTESQGSVSSPGCRSLNSPDVQFRTSLGAEAPDAGVFSSLPWEQGPVFAESEAPCSPGALPCVSNVVGDEEFPWRQNGFHEEFNPRTDESVKENTEQDECPLPPPWKEYTCGSPPGCQDMLNGNPVPSHCLSLDMNNGNPAHVGWAAEESSIPPPPWRTPSTEADSVPVRSPSCSKELDSFSLQPQPSNHSLRLSEAESRHSEPFHLHHHVLELPHRGVELDWSAIVEDADSDEIPQEDTWSRVNAWLLTCDPDQQEVIPDDAEEVEIVVQSPDCSTINLQTQSTSL